MAQVKSMQCLGRASGGQPAAQPGDFVRFQEFSGTLAGKAAAVHRHAAADIDGLIPFLLTLAADALAESQSIIWEISGSQLSSAQVRLKPAGGLRVDSEGVAVDPVAVSVPGHHHVTADLDDFAAALYAQLQTLYAASPTIEWGFDGSTISGTVRVRAAAGLLETADGLAVDFGSGTAQAARGDHTHALLHAPLTLGASVSVDLELAAQQLTAEVRLAPLPGLLIDGAGLRVDFGSGTNQAARGNHGHAQLHDPLTAVNDAALSLSVTGQVLSGTVRRSPAPPGGFGKVALNPDGLMVELGTNPDQAAAGNHGHSVATESAAGFLSAADKTRLDTLWVGAPSGTGLPASGTMDSLTLRVLYLVNVNTGQQRAIYLDDLGNVAVISGSVVSTGTVMTTTEPEGALIAVPGIQAFNTVLDHLWIKKTGTGNTGWKQLV